MRPGPGTTASSPREKLAATSVSLVWGVLVLGAAVVAVQEQRTYNPPTAPDVAPGDSYARRFQVSQPALTTNGASSCASTQCHGGAVPRPGEVFTGNEYDLWHAGGKGPHFRAFKVLYEDPRSDRMARLLYGPAAVAKERSECLACHTLAALPEKQGRAWTMEEGVTCELCHGRSELWMGKHSNPRQWRGELSEAQRTELGFYDTRNLVYRAEKCLECHGGVASKLMTHQMLAAGHPPLRFELVSDLDRVPKHWNDGQCYLNPDEGSFFHARVWAVGQAVALREALNRVATGVREGASPDYSLFECYGCHHDLKPAAWRRPRGFPAAPGEPMWDASPAVLLRPLVKNLMPDRVPEWDRHTQDLVSKLRLQSMSHSDVRTVCLQFAEVVDQFASKVNAEPFSRERVIQVLRAITYDRDRLAGLGYAAAAQSFLSVDALYRRALAQAGEKPANHAAIYKSLAGLHDILFDENEKETPWLYEPSLFVKEMSELGREFAELPGAP